MPIVHIAPPSQAGVSRNRYEQFNVPGKGLILNNSTGNVPTAIGGWITGNLQLGPTPARIILNEVTGPDASQLKGMIEVGGQRADIVIANPSGITCDGCGFLNANRATLSTGMPQFGIDGALTGLDVRQGVISVGPAGLNATEQQQLDLLARGLVIEGDLFANDLQALIGANQVLYGTLSATAQAGTDQPPRFAVDIKNLGGMYAGQIYLIATEKGLGVNSTGRMASLTGNLQLSAQGELSLKDSYSAKDLLLTTPGKASATGRTLAEGAARIDATQLANHGVLQADRLELNTQRIDNGGSIAQTAPGANLALNLPGGLTNTGTVYTAGNLDVRAAFVNGSAEVPGKLQAGGALSVQAETLELNGQHLAANQDVSVQASTLRATASTIQAGGQAIVQSTGSLELTGATVRADASASLSGSIVAVDRSTIAALGNVQVTGTRAVSASAAQISSNANVNVQGASVDLRGVTLAAAVTLTQSDIQNRDVYDASSYSIGASFSGKMGDQSTAVTPADKAAAAAPTAPGGSAGIGSASASQGSITASGISAGVLTITDGAKQQVLTGASAAETVAATNRDVTTGQDTSAAITKAWNGPQLMADVQAQAQITAAFGSAAAKEVGQYAGRKEKEALANKDPIEAATGQQLLRPEMFADTANPAFYKQFVQSGISRDLNSGLLKELKDSGISAASSAAELAQKVKDNPGLVASAVWEAVKNLPQGVVDSFKETGTAIGEGSAVALSPDLTIKLNAIYGTDTAGAQKAILAIRVTAAVTGAAGTAKAATGLTDAGATAIAKKLDAALDQKAFDGLLKSGGVYDSNGVPLLDLKQLSDSQKGVLGDVMGANTVRQIVPDGQKLARVPGVGETGIDDLYKVSRPDVDFVVVEYKFVGDSSKLGSSSLGTTLDGKQGSSGWIVGSDRLERSVGADSALDVRAALKGGRVETWVVTTRADGSTEIQVLNSLGRTKSVDTSKILSSINSLTGARP